MEFISGFSAYGFDDGSHEMFVNTGTAVEVTVGKGVLVLGGVRVNVGLDLIGLVVAIELQPKSKKIMASNEV